MKKEYQLPSDISEVQTASSQVLALLRPLNLGEDKLFDVRLCLEEALINAIRYGNKQNKELKVRLAVECDENELRITVEDKGEGFDLTQLKDCTSDDNLLSNRGRGVYLIHRLMDKVQYNSKGNSVLMVKYLKSVKNGNNKHS